MIEWLRGGIKSLSQDRCILDVGGVGYGLEITHSAAKHLKSLKAEEQGELWVRTILRENLLALYGFSSQYERDVFDMLILASRVGPRSAVGAISALGPDKLVLAIVDQDTDILVTIPGVGKKTAAQIALDLKKRMEPLAHQARARRIVTGDAPASSGAKVDNSDLAANLADAMAGLVALGTPDKVARDAVEKAAKELGQDAATEDLIREGLKHRRRRP